MTCRKPKCGDLCDRLAIERYERLASHSRSRSCDDPICEVAASIEKLESCPYGWAIHGHILSLGYRLDRQRYFVFRQAINTSKHPNQFTKTWQRKRYCFGLLKNAQSHLCLTGVIANYDANEKVGVDGYPHSIPAQPFLIASFISSIVATLSVWPERIPTISAQSPFLG